MPRVWSKDVTFWYAFEKCKISKFILLSVIISTSHRLLLRIRPPSDLNTSNALEDFSVPKIPVRLFVKNFLSRAGANDFFFDIFVRLGHSYHLILNLRRISTQQHGISLFDFCRIESEYLFVNLLCCYSFGSAWYVCTIYLVIYVFIQRSIYIENN